MSTLLIVITRLIMVTIAAVAIAIASDDVNAADFRATLTPKCVSVN